MSLTTGINPSATKRHHIAVKDTSRIGNRQYRRALCSQLVHTPEDHAGLRSKRGLSRVNYSELPICIHCEHIANGKESHP
jgi:hypothetical protein